MFAATALTIASLLLLPLYSAMPTDDSESLSKRCTGTISSLSDVTAAVKCTTININSFTVPGGQTFTLTLLSGTTVNLNGDITFAVDDWAGPQFLIKGTSITFNGNGHTFNGLGASYWDGEGGSGGVTKPAPMLKIESTGTFQNLKVLNSPERAISVDVSSTTVLTGITVDNSAGASKGKNTDCFDVSSSNLTIENCTCINQDDCLAINKGSNIVFKNNSCSGGHGISIGSISSSVTVSGVTISGNTITNSVQALRIKTDATATGSTVSGVTYTGNKASGIASYGVIIDQSYPDTLGTPGIGVIISGVAFTGTNTISVNSGAKRLEINCGSTTSCAGTWNLAGLTITGGSAGAIKNAKVTGGTY